MNRVAVSLASALVAASAATLAFSAEATDPASGSRPPLRPASPTSTSPSSASCCRTA